MPYDLAADFAIRDPIKRRFFTRDFVLNCNSMIWSCRSLFSGTANQYITLNWFEKLWRENYWMFECFRLFTFLWRLKTHGIWESAWNWNFFAAKSKFMKFSIEIYETTADSFDPKLPYRGNVKAIKCVNRYCRIILP